MSRQLNLIKEMVVCRKGVLANSVLMEITKLEADIHDLRTTLNNIKISAVASGLNVDERCIDALLKRTE